MSKALSCMAPPGQLPSVIPRREKFSWQGTPLSVYHRQKANGERRENGALKLKKLTARHYEIIGRHLQGESGEQIAAVMRISYVTVSRILNDPMAQEVIVRAYKDREGEVNALAGLAVDVVRDSLFEGSVKEKLAAVDRFVKLKGVMGNEAVGEETAEDVMQRVLERATVIQGDVNIQVNNR